MTGATDAPLGWPDREDEARTAGLTRGETDVEVFELTTAEWARISLADRLHGSLGRRLTVATADGTRHVGELAEAHERWLVLTTREMDVLVYTSELMTVAGLGDPLGHVADDSARRAQAVWREWGRQRRQVTVALRNGISVTGSVARVGSDSVDVVVHPKDRSPAPEDEHLTVNVAAVSWVAGRR